MLLVGIKRLGPVREKRELANWPSSIINSCGVLLDLSHDTRIERERQEAKKEHLRDIHDGRQKGRRKKGTAVNYSPMSRDTRIMYIYYISLTHIYILNYH